VESKVPVHVLDTRVPPKFQLLRVFPKVAGAGVCDEILPSPVDIAWTEPEHYFASKSG
jgi:hypothetical protein